MLELIIIFSILFGFLCFKNFYVGIYFAFLLLPSYRVQFDILGFPMNLLSIIIWIIVFVFFIKNIKNISNLFRNFKQNITTNSFFKNFRWPISVILIMSYLAIFYSSSQIKALGIFKSYFLECLFLFIVLAFTIKTKQQFKNIIYSLGILSILIFILGLYQKLTGDFAFNTTDAIEKGRITTFFGYPNANGLILVPVFFLNLLNLFEDKKLHLKIFNVLVFVLIFLTIFWSKSESAIIAIISGLIIFASLKFFNSKKYFIFVVSSVMLISFVFPFLVRAPSKIDEPNTKIYSIKEKLLLQDLSGQIRRQMYKETIDFIKDNPIRGAGLVGYQEKIVNYHKFNYIEIFLYPHNIFLNFWIALGIFGLIGFFWLIIEFMRVCIKSYFNNSKEQIFILLTMLAVVIQGTVEVPYFKNDLSIVWWFIVLGCLLFRVEK